ncbi:MAG: hypothetical protein H0X42_07815 [Solirubrobacterales bacterium]|nr:hypothetical protein [Solirubrobacterales bacterium]
MLKSRLTVALVAVAALLALPAAAQATLTYMRNPFHPVVYVSKDNGKGARKVAAGRNPKVSPDGELVVYLAETNGQLPVMKIAPAGGGAGKTLMSGWQESFYLEFSPDSTTIAALRGGELGARKLVLIDVATGAQRVLAGGYFSGFSFSPDGTEIVYAKASKEGYPPKCDVYRANVSGGKSVALTHDHASLNPLWGPTGQIVFVKLLGAKQRKYGPENDLFLMNSSGSQVKRLTHTQVDPLVQGLIPTAWSASGKQLLAEFGGQDTSYAVTVNPKTGAERTLTKERESGFVGTALSADGKYVLGMVGGYEPTPNHAVVKIPYAGGQPKVLVKNGFEPDWSL